MEILTIVIQYLEQMYHYIVIHKLLRLIGLHVFMYLLTSEAVVGLEKTLYSVSEDEGVVEVCAIVYSPTIDCPIEFSFNVNLSTSDRTAGILLFNVHYISSALCMPCRLFMLSDIN